MSAAEGVKDPLSPWLVLFDEYRIASFPHDEVVSGTLPGGYDENHPAVAFAVGVWPGRLHLGRRKDGVLEVALVREVGDPPNVRRLLHLTLFAMTIFTTLMAGALLQGVDPLASRAFQLGAWSFPMPSTVDFEGLWLGVPFSFTLLVILGAHEMGHYFAARFHGVRASLPYFLPVPAYFSIVGTFGAFIRIKGPSVRRSILFDIGVAGPLASFVLSVVAVGVGLGWSTPSGYQASTLSPFLVRFAEQPVGLGSSLVSNALAFMRFPALIGIESIELHAVAFAGWVGLFLTSLNLLPFGQLDGGHVAYGVLGRRQAPIAWLFILLLIPLGMVWWGWWLWGAVAVVVSRGRLAHPPVLQPDHQPDRTRALLAVISCIIFFITFIPFPMNIFG